MEGLVSCSHPFLNQTLNFIDVWIYSPKINWGNCFMMGSSLHLSLFLRQTILQWLYIVMQVLKVSNDSLLAPKLIENFTPNIKRHFAFSTIQSHTVQDTVWLIQTLVQVLILFVDLRLLIRIDLENLHWLNRRVFWNEKTGLHQTIFPTRLRNYFETV